MSQREVRVSQSLNGVRYEIRGSLARRAEELERVGYEITKLNIGNPGAFGFQMPAIMRRAIVENLHQADPYCHQKGIFPAREAVANQQHERGVLDVTADDVVIGNGVSELIMLCMRALLDAGDEVLIPSPDYPLWTAAVTIHGAKAVHYDCLPQNAFMPDPEQIEALITPRTRAIVIINPNNPTGAVYGRELLQAIVDIATRHGLVLFSDEIYDEILYDGAKHVPVATLGPGTLCATFSGLSKVYRACGLRVGWVSFSGEKANAREYLNAVELLASLRLCSNVPGQWAVQTALGGYQSIRDLTSPGGRLYESRKALIEAVRESEYLELTAPQGALYAFVRVKSERLKDFEDTRFALDLLEQQHVLLAPGTSFNVPYTDHFRTTFLPEAQKLRRVFERIDELLYSYEHGVPSRRSRAHG
ncbi:MAG: pyridoxal phosphate-dependent aminotransferase [Pseudomonadota bacterium]